MFATVASGLSLIVPAERRPRLLSPEGTLVARLTVLVAGGGAIAEAVFTGCSVVNCPP